MLLDPRVLKSNDIVTSSPSRCVRVGYYCPTKAASHSTSVHYCASKQMDAVFNGSFHMGAWL